MLHSRANPADTVHAFLKRNGPMTLSELASHVGHDVSTVRNHLMLHRDAYAYERKSGSCEHKTWYVKGPIL